MPATGVGGGRGGRGGYYEFVCVCVCVDSKYFHHVIRVLVQGGLDHVHHKGILGRQFVLTRF
jgi:hypothetical protein